jgi:hypothetical protein
MSTIRAERARNSGNQTHRNVTPDGAARSLSPGRSAIENKVIEGWYRYRCAAALVNF